MQPTILSKVVLPEPLGPFNTVTLFSAMFRFTLLIAENSFGLPALKTFLTLTSSIMAYSPVWRIAVSGSMVAARQVGTMVATVYGTTVRKNSVVSCSALMNGVKSK